MQLADSRSQLAHLGQRRLSAPERIEDARKKGAQYFVVSAQSLAQYAENHADLDAYLSQHFRKINDQDGIIYDLRP